MTHHVLVISLGPVQGFIAAARRCRDLWFGSWLLSELAKSAAAGVLNALGADEALVFPAPESRDALKPGSAMSVANKLVVRVPGDGRRAREVALRGHEQMRSRLNELRTWAFERTGREDPLRDRHFLEGLATMQIDEAFEYFWVAVPEPAGESGYAAARSEAERQLAARKNTRTWDQPRWSCDGLPKSSLDGARESVLDEGLFERSLNGPRRPAAVSAEARRQEAEARRQHYGVHGSERLCGIGILKRRGVRKRGVQGEERFVSTAHLAALPLLLGIAQEAERGPEIKAAWDELCVAAGPAKEVVRVGPGIGTGPVGNVDGGILLESHLVETLEDFGRAADSEFTRDAVAALKKLLSAVGRDGPIPYYAILVADGDGMGSLIRKLQFPEEHRDLSRRLNRFAQQANGIVTEHDGCLIYSGGDDVLALLPLHQALECAQQLAQTFTEHVGDNATLSAGLAFAHFIEPMGHSLEVAREAERHAKRFTSRSRDGTERAKDALAIALDKRSGETTTICGHWDQLVPRLLALVELRKLDEISHKAGYELAELARLGPGLGDIQRCEALRILSRKRARRGEQEPAEEVLRALQQHVGVDVAALGQELVVASWLAKAKQQREGTCE